MIPCSHVAASAARSRRDHCLVWTRLATPAAGRWRPVHLQVSILPAVHRLLDSLTQLDELHKTVQQRVDDVQKWSVQMYWTTRLAAKRDFPPIKGPPRTGPRRLRFRSNTDLVYCQLVYSRLELPPRHPSTRTSVTMGRSNGPRTTTHALGPQALRIEGCEFGSIT